MAFKSQSGSDRLQAIMRIALDPAGVLLALAPRRTQTQAARPGPDPEANLGYISRGHDRQMRAQAKADAERMTQPAHPNIQYSPLGNPIREGVRYNERSATNRQANPFFGPAARIDEATHLPRAHWGVDLIADVGSPAYAVNSGVVVRVGKGGGLGDHVVLDFGDGYGAVYAHLSDTAGLKAGDRVQAGQQIGKTGRTDIKNPKTNAHLHFELRRGHGNELLGLARPPGQPTKAIDPMPYLGYRR